MYVFFYPATAILSRSNNYYPYFFLFFFPRQGVKSFSDKGKTVVGRKRNYIRKKVFPLMLCNVLTSHELIPLPNKQYLDRSPVEVSSPQMTSSILYLWTGLMALLMQIHGDCSDGAFIYSGTPSSGRWFKRAPYVLQIVLSNTGVDSDITEYTAQSLNPSKNKSGICRCDELSMTDGADLLPTFATESQTWLLVCCQKLLSALLSWQCWNLALL